MRLRKQSLGTRNISGARADRASDYINGFGDGVEYAMRVLGMEEAKG